MDVWTTQNIILAAFQLLCVNVKQVLAIFLNIGIKMLKWQLCVT